MKKLNAKLISSVLIAGLLVGCQTTKPVVDTNADDTTSVVIPADTGSNSTGTTGLGEYDPTVGSDVDASANGIVKDAYGNIIGEMVNGVFVPCDDCPTPNSGSVNTGVNGDFNGVDPLSVMTIYFDYDQVSIKPEFRSVLEAHANNVANSGLQLRLEGHADERGSREYNIGLGERRAQAVKRAMMLSGANSGALTTISYGEEQPAVSGAGESSYSQNRRVVLVYR